MLSTSNLKPFTGADDSRRQNGRRKGSKNLSSIVNELLNESVDLSSLDNECFKKYKANSKTTFAKAVALAMIYKAVGGDVRAATWISSYADRVPDESGYFAEPQIVFNVVGTKEQAHNLE